MPDLNFLALLVELGLTNDSYLLLGFDDENDIIFLTILYLQMHFTNNI